MIEQGELILFVFMGLLIFTKRKNDILFSGGRDMSPRFSFNFINPSYAKDGGV